MSDPAQDPEIVVKVAIGLFGGAATLGGGLLVFGRLNEAWRGYVASITEDARKELRLSIERAQRADEDARREAIDGLRKEILAHVNEMASKAGTSSIDLAAIRDTLEELNRSINGVAK